MNKDNLSLEIFPNGIKLYQSENLYKFTKDAIDLAKFVKLKKTDRVLDMCAGVGVVGLYAYSLQIFEKLYFVEIQKSMCEIIKKNIDINNLNDKAHCFCCNLNSLTLDNFEKRLDAIVCNPPYFKVNGKSKLSNNFNLDRIKSTNVLENCQERFSCLEGLCEDKKEFSKICARHELLTDFEAIVKKSRELLVQKGRLYIIGIPERLCEMVICLNKYNFECKRIQINSCKTRASLILIEAVLNGKSGVSLTIN